MKTYKSIDGSTTLQTNREFIGGEAMLVSRYHRYGQENIFAEAMLGRLTLFEGLETGQNELGDDDNKIAIWYQSEEDLELAARYEPMPEILDILCKKREMEYKLTERKVFTVKYPFAPMFVGHNMVAIILPDFAYERRDPFCKTAYEALAAEIGICALVTSPKRLMRAPVEGVTPPSREAVEEIFSHCRDGLCNLISGDITFGSEFDRDGDWAECVNIPIWHAPFYDEELLPAKQAILRAFRRAFGYVPIIRFTFGS